MRTFDERNITKPELSEGWYPIQIGFTKLELRLINYASIAVFFAANGFCFYLWDFKYLQDFLELAAPTPISSIIIMIIFLVGYFILHEMLHVVSHPDYGLSDKTMVGLGYGTVFVLFNEEISKRRMLVVLLMPFIAFTFFTMLIYYFELVTNEAILVNIIGLHITACFGDFLLCYKFVNDRSFTIFWNAYSSSWAK